MRDDIFESLRRLSLRDVKPAKGYIDLVAILDSLSQCEGKTEKKESKDQPEMGSRDPADTSILSVGTAVKWSLGSFTGIGYVTYIFPSEDVMSDPMYLIACEQRLDNIPRHDMPVDTLVLSGKNLTVYSP